MDQINCEIFKLGIILDNKVETFQYCQGAESASVRILTRANAKREALACKWRRII